MIIKIISDQLIPIISDQISKLFSLNAKTCHKNMMVRISLCLLLISIGSILLLSIGITHPINITGPMLALQNKTGDLEAQGRKVSKAEIENIVAKSFSSSLRDSFIISVVGNNETWMVVCFQRRPNFFSLGLSSKDDTLTVLTSSGNRLSVIHSDGTVEDIK